PLQTEFIQVNYAKAGQLASLIKAEENNLLSERGTVTIDERTNTLIVQDVATSLEAIRSMVNKLDIPIRQVLIESRIVNADESFTKNLGIQFGATKDRGQDPWGSDSGDSTALDVSGVNGGPFISTLPVAGAFGGFSLAYGIVGSWLLQLELTAALAEGRGEDIANPKVITADQNEALIESGVEIPYEEASSSGATSVSFKKAVLSLRVTPQITPDDRVLLDLQVDQDTQGAEIANGIPVINTKSVATQVLVDNGETVVLGGVYTQTKNNTLDRVPFFGDLPYVGFLFKRTQESRDKSELLIFVTPKILKENLRI
ncbi:MAG: type IV pilus secretin PilQ, partial [Gammaproteobacteria bacterium]|nr:type IV pilus secretin PilQ [Gammaproteobacteria bacterium]